MPRARSERKGTHTQILATGKQRSAKLSQIVIQGTSLAYASWDVTLNLAKQKTVNFTSYVPTATPQPQTFDEEIGTVFGADLRWGGDWDAGLNPIGDPPGLFPRDDLAGMKFVINRIDNTLYTFPYTSVRQAHNGGVVDNKVLFDCTGGSQGQFTVSNFSV